MAIVKSVDSVQLNIIFLMIINTSVIPYINSNFVFARTHRYHTCSGRYFGHFHLFRRSKLSFLSLFLLKVRNEIRYIIYGEDKLKYGTVFPNLQMEYN